MEPVADGINGKVFISEKTLWKDYLLLASSSSHAVDTLRALASATTSKSKTGRNPCSILDMVDWSILSPNTCNLAAKAF